MESFIIILITILGLVFGSFLGCMGYRIPNKVSTFSARSCCESCGKPLKWYMNIPVLSYVFLKGKCKYCKEQINFIYPFVEILCALLFLCNYLLFDFTINFYITTIITCALMVTIVSDFLYYYISDRVIIISGVSILITLICFLDKKEIFIHIISAAIIFIIMYLIKILGNKLFKRESLGDGDIKLMSIVGLSLGLVSSFISLFLASFFGLIFSFILVKKNKEGIIPFGPFLLMGALFTVYFSNIITPIVEKLFIW